MKDTQNHFVSGILLLYHHYLFSNAPTIMDHVTAFQKHSQFNVWSINTEIGFPEGLKRLRFQIIVLHYSLFGPFYLLNEAFMNYLQHSQSSYKIAFFQDEHRYCKRRFEFLNNLKIDCVYTLLEPQYFKEVYEKYTHVPRIIYTLPGYVSDHLVETARDITKPFHERTIDIGYRARQLSFYMGKGAQEKNRIGAEFRKCAIGLGLTMDIETEEQKRVYGNKWYEFLSRCKAVLGVEAGVSIFDIEDKVRIECEQLIEKNPRISFDEVFEKVLHSWEGNIPYRTISPRHFEAAALRVLQILFEGNYSGIMKPMIHYIPLKKDFSNFNDVLNMFREETPCHDIIENTYRDLISSGKYSYHKFVESFDQRLLMDGYNKEITAEEIEGVDRLLEQGRMGRQIRANLCSLRHYSFPGRKAILLFARPTIRIYRKYRKRVK
jgi:hypothetical protein